jgi:hypothetical protein
MTDEPENYTKWPVIRHTMLMDHLPIDSSWKIVSENIHRFSVEQALQPPVVGEPDWYKGYSRGMIEQAAHLAQWENKSGKTIYDLKTVVELGGGYGMMALLFFRLGYGGDYIIIDLPEMCLFQEWFLSQHGAVVQHYPSLYDIKTTAPLHADLLIAIDSLSETSMPFRQAFWSRVSADNFIFRYVPIWDTHDNVAYFDKLISDTGMQKYLWEAQGWVSKSAVCWR